jgi:catechol 2,3-dioxygenase-like lactoylglutathione lyase family enzyme
VPEIIRWASIAAGKFMAYGFELDHISLLVSSLAATTRFYTEVLGLEQIENVNGNPKIRWFGLGGLRSLHVTEGDFAGTVLKKPTHFALATADFDAFLADLEAKGVTYYDWPGVAGKVAARADGVRQIYLLDPDGYWVEINTHC